MKTAPSASGSLALPRWQRWAIYSSVALLLASGLAWIAIAWPSGGELAAPQRIAAVWLLRVHGVAAYATLVVIGSVLPLHLRLAWARDRNRISGGVLVGVLATLALTGLWLYYGPESGREFVSTGHWLVGLALPVWLLLHRAWGRRSRRQAIAASRGSCSDSRRP